MDSASTGTAGGRTGGWLIPNGTVFVASACIMIVELVAGRMISRYVGQSIYTWTSVIGIVLAGLAVGNFLGGRIADRYAPRRALALLFLLSALSCLSVPALNYAAGRWEALWTLSWPARILAHVSIVFLLPAAMLGTIGPVVARMALEGGRGMGRALGGVYAWGAIGSIVGVLAAGYVLIAILGITAIVTGVAFVLALLGAAYGAGSWRRRQ